ncbi:CDP-alcohol phosphatidyltransferase [Perkinsus olseni]|uniref:CDP-alcohol phosphatidyltransferase n=1 Tax=Perkinsus olseni TaxID=32597 RepID=A0A7J6L1X3_PEROL|nr:CDP-alcohol phosphatidyltransferase [Perkinsus olseni]
MTTFSVATLFQFGSGYRTLYVMLIGAVPFFFASWEQFYAGEFIMPQINGPSEGIFILIAVFIIGYASDDYTHFYHRKLSFSFPLPFSSDHHYVSLEYCDIPLIGCTIFAILVIYTNIRNVIRHERMKKEEYDNNNNTTTTPPHHRNNNNGSVMMMTTRQEGYLKHYGGKRPRIRDALSCAFPFCLGGILSSLWVCWSYDNVMDKHPRLVIWMIGLIFSKLVTHIQVAHVCGEKYSAWRKTYLLPLIIIPINCGIGYYFGSADNATTSSFTGGAPPIDESSLLIFMTFTAAIGWINMAYGVLTEMDKSSSTSCEGQSDNKHQRRGEEKEVMAMNDDKGELKEYSENKRLREEDDKSDDGRPTIWAHEYSPKRYTDLLTDERINRRVLEWLYEWKDTNNNTTKVAVPSMMIGGPSGVGKSSLIRICAQQARLKICSHSCSSSSSSSSSSVVSPSSTIAKKIEESLLASNGTQLLVLDQNRLNYIFKKETTSVDLSSPPSTNHGRRQQQQRRCCSIEPKAISTLVEASGGNIAASIKLLESIVSTVKRDYCKDSRPSLTTIGGKKRKSVDGKDDISSIRHHHHYRGEVDEPPAATSTTAAKRTRIDLRQWLGIVSDSAAASAGEVAGAVVGSSGNDDGNTPRDRNRVAGENYDDTWVAGNDEVCSSCFEFDFNEGHTNAVKKTVYVRDLILPPPPRHNSTIKMHE